MKVWIFYIFSVLPLTFSGRIINDSSPFEPGFVTFVENLENIMNIPEMQAEECKYQHIFVPSDSDFENWNTRRKLKKRSLSDVGDLEIFMKKLIVRALWCQLTKSLRDKYYAMTKDIFAIVRNVYLKFKSKFLNNSGPSFNKLSNLHKMLVVCGAMKIFEYFMDLFDSIISWQRRCPKCPKISH